MKNSYFLFHYWKSFIIIAIILYLSFASPSTFKEVPTFKFEDKLIHLLMYGGLTGILIFDFRQYAKNNYTTFLAFILVCLLFPATLGGAVEIIQPIYFPPRSAEWLDWCSDLSGVLVGWFVMSWISPRILKRHR